MQLTCRPLEGLIESWFRLNARHEQRPGRRPCERQVTPLVASFGANRRALINRLFEGAGDARRERVAG